MHSPFDFDQHGSDGKSTLTAMGGLWVSWSSRPLCQRLTRAERRDRRIAIQLQFTADAMVAEMVASPLAEPQRALKTEATVVSTQIARAAKGAPSCTGCTRPPTGHN
jgi:hypothetical protein